MKNQSVICFFLSQLSSLQYSNVDSFHNIPLWISIEQSIFFVGWLFFCSAGINSSHHLNYFSVFFFSYVKKNRSLEQLDDTLSYQKKSVHRNGSTKKESSVSPVSVFFSLFSFFGWNCYSISNCELKWHSCWSGTCRYNAREASKLNIFIIILWRTVYISRKSQMKWKVCSTHLWCTSLPVVYTKIKLIAVTSPEFVIRFFYVSHVTENLPKFSRNFLTFFA